MQTSLFSFVRNALSLGYPIIEAVYNLLPLASELILVDCGSTDGTKELLQSLTVNPHIQVHHDTWIPGRGGKNINDSGNLCHKLCNYDTIVFVEGDEVWEENLVETARIQLDAGNNHLKFWRFQLTQNFQRSSWYLEREQLLNRIFRRGSCLIVEANSDLAHTAIEVPITAGYIVDCRNNFRDLYLQRDQALKEIYGSDDGKIRMVPAHSNYSWAMTPAQVAQELQDVRWTWTTTPFRLPKILTWHLGRPRYEVRPELVERLKAWQPHS